jgi:ornithine cyclodeaminase
MALVLGEADVRQLLKMPALIDAMERALTAYSNGLVQQPVRTVMKVGADIAFFGVMPAHQQQPAALGAKLVCVSPGNAGRGLPTHLATILLIDSTTGELQAVLDGRYITEARTAAASAAATRRLACEGAAVLGILGSGVQAASHLEALALVRPLREVRVWSPTPANRERFAVRHSTATLPVRAVQSARDAVAAAEIIVCATSSAVPVLRHEWVGRGAHICAVGACRPDMREMDTPLVAAGRLFVDSRAGALSEAGDLLIPIEEGRFHAADIAGEAGELFAGRVPGRTSAADITIFKSLGMAIEDVAAAEMAYRRAVEIGLGRGLVL